MPSYQIPDLTGINPAYLVTGDTYKILRHDQKIIFDSPIYADGLVINRVVDSLEAKTNTPLVLGTDYLISADDVDYTTMSKMPINNSEESKQVLKSITFNFKEGVLPIPVVLSYQSVYNANLQFDPSELGGDIVLTPTLIKTILNRVGSLEMSQVYAKNNVAAPEIYTSPKLLVEDINCVNPDNVIKDEVYTVSYSQKNTLIVPMFGSFFGDGLSVTLEDGTLLTLDIDYTPVFSNFAKVKQSTNTSGIYDAILITRVYEGKLKITYHAVGGELTRADLVNSYTLLYGVRDYLDNINIVNSNNIHTQPIVQLHSQQLNNIENNMRILLSKDTANYGNSTNGVTKTASLKSNDTNLHWWTIASLYKTSNVSNATVVIKDRLKIHVQLSSIGYISDVEVSVNLASLTPVSITTRNTICDMKWDGITPVYTSGFPTFVSIPQYRVIWSIVDGKYAGAFLQIGIPLPTNDTLAVEDTSGVESCWMLVDTISADYSDTNITLPDGMTVWAEETNGCKSYTQSSDTGPAGLLVSYGSVAGNALFTDTKATYTTTVSTLTNPFKGIDSSMVKSVDVGYTITDGTTSYDTIINIPINKSDYVDLPKLAPTLPLSRMGSVTLPLSQRNCLSVYIGTSTDLTKIAATAILFTETKNTTYRTTSIVLRLDK